MGSEAEYTVRGTRNNGIKVFRREGHSVTREDTKMGLGVVTKGTIAGQTENRAVFPISGTIKGRIRSKELNVIISGMLERQVIVKGSLKLE